ncbi:DUF1049 domain-containing protein [Streptomyces boncukensis]|uniref:DUF1049 domain-containing protein n=1 Tax=Streptomyces boncukensis TaxID=2711219 RepID=A0A6G4X5A3_9ACTN|nr:DUF1049 domain-containing protein [Streptomyces boncukensis]NGO71914.1 DUF1049 domain-containing protein [Streptomyces boncukensis]
MSPKTTSSRAGGKSGVRRLMSPGRLTLAVLAVLALVFIFENTRQTKIRLLIPEVTMPLWMALLGMAIIGWLCGQFMIRRR